MVSKKKGNNNNNKKKKNGGNNKNADKVARKELESIRLAMKRLDGALLQDLVVQSPETLSHWRVVPEDIVMANDMLQGGAQLIHGTATKFTLISRLDLTEGVSLGQDLLKGCQHVSTSAMIVCGTNKTESRTTGGGSSLSLQKSYQHHCRAIVLSCLQLLDTILLPPNANAMQAPPRTGAVWSACDKIQQVPKSNRAAMRRDMLIWMKECNETIEEFQEALQENPQQQQEEGADHDDDDNEEGDVTWDGFLQGEGSGYQPFEVPVVEAALSIIKCSRGSVNVALGACECVGALAEKEDEEQSEDTGPSRLLKWIGDLHDMARGVGDNMTNVGTALYSPLVLEELQSVASLQTDRIVELHTFVLESNPNLAARLDAGIRELSNNVRDAAQKRFQQLQDAIRQAPQNQP